MEKSASKKRTKTSSTVAESPIKSKGDTDKQIKKKTKKNDDEDDMEVMIEAVRTASNPNKKNQRTLTEWEKSFNSLAKPKTNFCDNCGCLLPLTADSQINCKMCGFNVNADELEEHVIVTKAKPKSSIRQKGKKEEDKSNDRAIIDEKCPKCGHGKMYFYTMQLRSVDEGSTVFYECVKCAYKFSQNN